MALLMRAADVIALYSISAAAGYKFGWEIPKSQRNKTLFCSLSCPGLDEFISSGFTQW